MACCSLRAIPSCLFLSFIVKEGGREMVLHHAFCQEKLKTAIANNMILNKESRGVTGYCAHCRKEHCLPVGGSREMCYRLMAHMEKTGTLTPPNHAHPRPAPSTTSLFGAAGGKMFGVLECNSPSGRQVFLYGFSGQYEKQWLVAGWVPPLFDVAAFDQLNNPREKKIKELTRTIAGYPEHSEQWLALRTTRRHLCQDLMQRIHDLYRVSNFRGKTVPMRQAFIGKSLPTGTGDCCAPKLLQAAARAGLIPVGLSEFYWGRINSSQTRRHGHFYPPCQEKCQPLLGYMLCGLEKTGSRHESD